MSNINKMEASEVAAKAAFICLTEGYTTGFLKLAMRSQELHDQAIYETQNKGEDHA